MTRRIKRLVAATAVALAAVGFVAVATASGSFATVADAQQIGLQDGSEWS